MTARPEGTGAEGLLPSHPEDMALQHVEQPDPPLGEETEVTRPPLTHLQEGAGPRGPSSREAQANLGCPHAWHPAATLRHPSGALGAQRKPFPKKGDTDPSRGRGGRRGRTAAPEEAEAGGRAARAWTDTLRGQR